MAPRPHVIRQAAPLGKQRPNFAHNPARPREPGVPSLGRVADTPTRSVRPRFEQPRLLAHALPLTATDDP
jgi:hypothetical protein